MSAQYSKYLKFGSAIVIIVLALAYLAYTGVQESKSYYKTISELQTQASQSDAIYKMRLRVAGNVATGSIKRHGGGSPPKSYFPEEIAPAVFRCGFNARASYGAHLYFLQRSEGNLLIDSLRYIRRLESFFARVGEPSGQMFDRLASLRANSAEEIEVPFK